MTLYCLIGKEIVKRRLEFKSINSDKIPQTTILSADDAPLDQIKDAVTRTVEVNVQSQPAHVVVTPQDAKGLALPLLSKSFVSHISTSHLSLSHVASDHGPPRQSPVSFRQYILMPLMFFLVLLTIWLPPSIYRIRTLMNPNLVSYPLILTCGTVLPLMGFGNAIIFITIGMKGWKRQRKLARGVAS